VRELAKDLQKGYPRGSVLEITDVPTPPEARVYQVLI
jgi:hypothetical protein